MKRLVGRFPLSHTKRVLIALLLALALGMSIAGSGSSLLIALAADVEPIGTLWVNAIRMTVIPLVVSLLITSVADRAEETSLGRTGGQALLLFVGLLGGTAIFAALAAPPLFAWLPINATTMASVVERPSEATDVHLAGARELPGIGQWLTDLVPTNPIRAAADGAMLPLVLFSLLLALASTRVTPAVRQPIMSFFTGIRETMLVLVQWMVALAPIGVFALVLPLAARMGTAAVGALAYFVVAICSLFIVQILALYVVAALAGRVRISTFAQAVLPAQAVAFSSRSSLAALPALVEGAKSRLGAQPEIYGFVIPLAVSTFKVTWPISAVAGSLFVARLYGIELDSAAIAMIASTSILLSFSSPGIPSGSLVLLAPLFVSVGLPVAGIGMLIALDTIPDIFKTTSNVTADMAVAAILGRKGESNAQGASAAVPG